MTTKNLNEAQLYWDNQDAAAAGWWLRYRDENGAQQGRGILGVEDASLHDLAEQVEHELARADMLSVREGAIKVFRGDRHTGTIRIADGEVEWKAL